jgi:uncharacterized protein
MLGRHWIAIVAIMLASTMTAVAQTPSPEATAAARTLVTTMKMTEQFKPLLPLILKSLKPAMVKGRPEVERDFDAMTPTMFEAAAPFYGAMADAIAVLYANNFTLDELREMQAFYSKPIGQKMLEKTPSIAQQTLAIGESIAQKMGEHIRDRLLEGLRKKGHKI